jgi:Terpene cyclase DEP1
MEPAMSRSTFITLVALLGGAFAGAFCVMVLPPLVAHPDVVGAMMAGFVNPYASGYALDAITCWLILAVWVVHESRAKGIRHGWVALALGLAPGVATGLACYLILRTQQLSSE